MKLQRTVFATGGMVAAVGLVCALSACATEQSSYLDGPQVHRAGEGGNAIEDPDDDPGEVLDEGPEVNAGVEGPVTITQSQLGQLFSSDGVASQLQQQNNSSYVGSSVSQNGGAKIAALTGESIVSSEQSQGEWTGTTANYRFRVSPNRDQLYVRHNSKLFSDVAPTAVVSEAQIEAQAAADLDAIGIELAEGQQVNVSRLMRASSSDPDNPTFAAYKVFVGLELAGQPVHGTRIVLSYFGDGELHKVSAQWPAIDSPSGPEPLPSPGSILSQVYTKLASHPLGAETNPLETGAALTVEGGKLHHVVSVRGLLDNGDGQGRGGELDVVF